MKFSEATKEVREFFLRGDAFSYVIVFFVAVTFSYCLQPFGEQQYSYLASSFLHGRLYFLESPGWWGDAVSFGGHYYWPLGPFPAIVLMPFVAFFSILGGFFYQGYISFFITIATLLVWYTIIQAVGFSKKDARVGAFAFCFASSYLMIALWQWSWFLAHSIAVLLVSLALLEYLTKKRYAVIGILMALVCMTRITAGVGALFFFIDIFFLASLKSKEKKNALLSLCVPIGIAGALLALYNGARFGDVFNQGYGLQIVAIDALAKAKEYGLFSVVHIPANLYYMFLAPPLPVFRDTVSHVFRFPFIRPDPFGMSIFLTSPYLLALFFQKVRDRFSWALLATCVCSAIPLMLYYATGYVQFGNRYSLDFFPFLFLLFLHQYGARRHEKTFSFGMRALFVGAACVNLLLFFFSFYAG